MITPVFKHDAGKLSVFCIGNVVNTNEPEILVRTASQLTHALEIRSRRTIIQQFPAKKVRGTIWIQHRKWQDVEEKVVLNDLSADGVRIYDRDMTVVFNSSGPYLVLWSVEMGHALVLNCGLNQLRNTSEQGTRDSVIRNALSEIMGIWVPSEVRGIITMGSKANYFPDLTPPKVSLRHSRADWPIAVPRHKNDEIDDSVELALRQVEEFAIPRKNILHDGINTLTHERCASAIRPGNNMIIVHYRS